MISIDEPMKSIPRQKHAAVWMHAFYDDSYGEDQTERLAICSKVSKFLISIGCRVSWTVGHDGSDINHDYGIHISSVTYQGKEYEHDPCYQIRWELPLGLARKLDAEFEIDEKEESVVSKRRREREMRFANRESRCTLKYWESWRNYFSPVDGIAVGRLPDFSGKEFWDRGGSGRGQPEHPNDDDEEGSQPNTGFGQPGHEASYV